MALVIGASVLVGCAKGEDDPFISFKSRTNRLSGDWKLSKIDGAIAQNVGINGVFSSSTISITYDGSNEVRVERIAGVDPLIVTSTYQFAIKFDKDGKWFSDFNVFLPVPDPADDEKTITKNIRNTISGNWYWKDQAKNKISLKLVGDFQPDYGVYSAFVPNLFPYYIDGTYMLRELSSSSMVAYEIGNSTSVIDTITTSLNIEQTISFTR
jgi:hypothetical protein